RERRGRSGCTSCTTSSRPIPRSGARRRGTPRSSTCRSSARRSWGGARTGGYDPNTTSPDVRLIRAQVNVYGRSGIKPILWPRSGGSWPGYVFTGAPLRLPAGHFGLGHGARAHAPDEYYLIESSDPKLYGYDAAVHSFIDYLYELA
ncbi:MAG TPA: hypothetical protein VH165_11090, partial [Kofleriaceae bacterium]|nr:hypothetical protein [Kofleriaceae bacterium]